VKKIALAIVTHAIVLGIGFAAGIYALPILTAPPPPSDALVEAAAADSAYTARFRRDLADSDALHWGEGDVFVGKDTISLLGEIAPGPDYMLYLSPIFVETERDFENLKPEMALVGGVMTFENFVVPIPATVDPADFNTVVVWCESFGQFITAAQYR
jgi:hypothetical protein